MEINKILQPLVTRFINVNNYDKMKSILDIGFSGVEMIEKYSKLKNENVDSIILFQEEIKKYKVQMEKLENRNNEIKKEKEEIENRFFDIKNNNYKEKEILRKEESERFNSQLEFYKNQIKNLSEERLSLIRTFDEIKNKEIVQKTNELRENIEELKNENNYYKKLYVEKSKGTFYENELFPRMEEYNDTKLNNKWRILHVGSSCSSKCDFHFQNKDTGEIILIDTKNNEKHSMVRSTDIDKFINDVNKIGNSAIGGILIANNQISKKKNFEMNIVNKKILIYISNFNFENVGFIFSMLDLICQQSKTVKSSFDEETIKNNFIESYKFSVDRYNNLLLEKRKYENEMDQMKTKYFTLFNDDLELVYKGIDKLVENVKNKTNKDVTTQIVDFEKLEKGCKVIGKRTKYYLEYESNGTKYLQYFQNNYPKNKKIEKLQNSKNKNIVINTNN